MNFFSLTLFCVVSSIGFTLSEIGKVVLVEGFVKGVEKTLNERVLARGSTIYLEDSVLSAENSRAQIKFADGSLIGINPNTEFRVQVFRQSGSTSQFTTEVVRGGLRFLSGKISKENPDAVTFNTPTATMGLRGTMGEIYIGEDGNTLGACETGAITLSNESGTLMIGPKAGSDAKRCGRVMLGKGPESLNTRPEPLRLYNFPAPEDHQ